MDMNEYVITITDENIHILDTSSIFIEKEKVTLSDLGNYAFEHIDVIVPMRLNPLHGPDGTIRGITGNLFIYDNDSGGEWDTLIQGHLYFIIDKFQIETKIMLPPFPILKAQLGDNFKFEFWEEGNK
jgi:hypothetical protein